MTYMRYGLRFRNEEWADSLEVDERGWGRFQEQCRNQLVRDIDLDPPPSKVKRSSPVGYSSYVGDIPGSLKRYWIYTDGAQIEGRGTLEHWDFETPSALIARFVKEVSAEMQSNKSLNTDAGKAGAG
jgi:hypothetical protein